MNDMIEQLLDLTRARLAGGLGFMRLRTPVDLSALVQRVVDELHVAHPEREVTVKTIGTSSTSGDADRLLQLFSNLVANALHHGSQGTGVTIVVDGSADDIRVNVCNRGTIAPDLLPVLFDPFRGRQKGSSGGLGLGLFICQQIAVAHGGSVAVASNDTDGTVFTVRLPRRTISQKNASAEGAKTILIVEDDESIRESLREAFQEEGYETALASNGQEALDHLKNRSPRPDAVILDLVLPILDGVRVYAAMQEDPALARFPSSPRHRTRHGPPPASSSFRSQ